MQNNWPTKKLADLLDSFDAGAWGKPVPEGKGLLVLRSTNITNEGSLDFSNVAELNIHAKIEKLKLLDGDILLEKSGGGPDQPVGRVAYFAAPNYRVYSFANFIQRLRVKPDLIDNRFLFYRLFFLHKIGFTKKLQSQTTGIRNLKLSLYLKTEILLLPLKIQKQIVERMDKIAEAQKLNDGLIQKSNELFQSLLHKELDPTGPADAKDITGNKNWEEKKLGEICDVRDGTHESPKFYSSGIPLITSKNLIGVGVDFENINYISLEDHREIDKRSKVDDGDILFGMIGTIGNPVIVKKDREFSIKNVGLIKFITSNSINYFVYYSLLGNFIQKQVKKFSRGGTQKFVSLGNLRNLRILVPDKIIQKQIVEKLSAVQEYKKHLLDQKSKLKELFDSVLNKSMKGELD